LESKEEMGREIWNKERNIKIERNRERSKQIVKINKRLKGETILNIVVY
jgi:hypothetical protein